MKLELLPITFAIITAMAFLHSPDARGGERNEQHTRAFPGAEGYGAYAKGGRGGKVLFVTNLEDYDPKKEKPILGSLRAACSASGPRIVIFRVSGTIPLKAHLGVTEPYLTLAGQTAPGEGVCVKNYAMWITGTHDVVVRYLRFRPGDDVGRARLKRDKRWQTDALSVVSSQDVIIDHCSASWGNDEVLSLTGEKLNNITVQWTIIAESLDNSTHQKGRHGRGSIVGGHIGHGEEAAITLHHNLWAHHTARNPHFAGDQSGRPPGSRTDFRNNVVYNWGRICAENYTPQYTKVNFVANYLKPGPSTRVSQRKIGLTTGSKNAHVYAAGNYLDGFPEARKDNWCMIDPAKGVTRLHEPLSAPPVTMDDVQTAYEKVLAGAGATLPKRDAVDARVMAQVVNGTGRIIDSHHEVGAWPKLKNAPVPQDSDNDGMPDEWEAKYGLDPKRQDNNQDSDNDGYTDIEEYLNGTNPKKEDAG